MFVPVLFLFKDNYHGKQLDLGIEWQIYPQV